MAVIILNEDGKDDERSVFAVSVGQAVPNRRSKGAQSQLGAGKYGLEWLFHCHYHDYDIFWISFMLLSNHH